MQQFVEHVTTQEAPQSISQHQYPNLPSSKQGVTLPSPDARLSNLALSGPESTEVARFNYHNINGKGHMETVYILVPFSSLIHHRTTISLMTTFFASPSEYIPPFPPTSHVIYDDDPYQKMCNPEPPNSPNLDACSVQLAPFYSTRIVVLNDNYVVVTEHYKLLYVSAGCK